MEQESACDSWKHRMYIKIQYVLKDNSWTISQGDK